MDHPDYSERLLDHFRHPRNVGRLDPADAEALVVSPLHGDRLRLSFSFDGDRIAAVRFQCSGCAVAIAAGSVATELLLGCTRADALALGDADVEAALGGVPEPRRSCSLIVAATVREALAEP